MICPQNSLGKNTGVGSHSLLQGIFSTQGLNQVLLHYRQTFYHLRYKESPQKTLFKILLEEEKMLNIKISLDPDSFLTFDGKV